MSRYLIAYIATALTFVAMDFGWLTVMTPRLYKPDLGPLMLDKPNFPVAVAFYLLFIVGVVVFAVMPALGRKQWVSAAMLGALFGFLAYATYDLTNLATLKLFTVRLAIADMAWGAVVSGTAATVGYLVTRRIG
jgi:uncharacterized membrane protein